MNDALPGRIAVGLGLCCAIAFSGCAAENTGTSRLGGDISTSFNLSFDAVRAYRIGSILVVAYQRHCDNGESGLGAKGLPQVARLTIDLRQRKEDDKVVKYSRTDGQTIVSPVAVSRYLVRQGPTGTFLQAEQFPAIVSGEVEIVELGENPGDKVFGRFDLKFETSKSLYGVFDAKLTRP